MILDAEELKVEERKSEIIRKINEHYPNREFDFEIVILVCNHCFETWLLGCKGLYPEGEIEKESDFYPFYIHYNIEMNDPERMSGPSLPSVVSPSTVTLPRTPRSFMISA